jgi:serine/threonine-protein kinase
MSGHVDASRIYYDSARVIEERRFEELDDYRSSDWADRLGIIYAGLGLEEDAVQFVQGRIERFKAQPSATDLDDAVADLAEIYVMVGDHDAAIDQLEYLLAMPTGTGPRLLRLDPLYDPLRDHPRFRALLEKYE